MTSWQLLRRIVGFWQTIENPVFLHAIRRPPVWHGVYTQIAQATGFVLILGGLGCYAVTLLVFIVNNLLVLSLPLMLAWALLIGLTLSPVVAEERQRGTWLILRTLPFALDTLLLSKASGALWWIREVLRAMTGLLGLIAVGIGVVSMIVTPTVGDTSGASDMLLCIGAFTIPVISAALYLAERAQHFALTAAGVLAVSTSARTMRTAITGGTTLSVTLWLLDGSLAAAVILLHEPANMATPDPWLVLLSLGPVVGYMTTLPLLDAGLFVLLTLVLREIAIYAIWRWTLRRAADEG